METCSVSLGIFTIYKEVHQIINKIYNPLSPLIVLFKKKENLVDLVDLFITHILIFEDQAQAHIKCMQVLYMLMWKLII